MIDVAKIEELRGLLAADTSTDWQTIRAESAESREAALKAENERLRKALIDATAHLAAATSSYERFCRRGVTGDALYTTKLDDYQKATARARSELEAGHE